MSSRDAWSTEGRVAAAAWLSQRRIAAPGPRWHVEIQLDVRDEPAPADFSTTQDSRFHIEIYAEEWGFFFCHAGRASWIRITDVPFVHVRDDHKLLPATPKLPELGTLLRRLEGSHALSFRRDHARIRTTLDRRSPTIRRWIMAL